MTWEGLTRLHHADVGCVSRKSTGDTTDDLPDGVYGVAILDPGGQVVRVVAPFTSVAAARAWARNADAGVYLVVPLDFPG